MTMMEWRICIRYHSPSRERSENVTSTDWEGFIRGLRKIGFDQVLSFETAPVLTAFPQELKAQALTLIAQIGAYFAKKNRKLKYFSIEKYSKWGFFR